MELTSVFRASPAFATFGKKRDLQFDDVSLSGRTGQENLQPLVNLKELPTDMGGGGKKASHWATEMATISTRSSHPSGAFMPREDQR